MKILIKFKKFISIITASCLLLSFVIGPTAANAMTNEEATAKYKQIFKDFMLPYSYGQITSAHFAGTDRVIINIQDLHCHPKVQRNISNIIEIFDKSFGVKNVYLEGVYGHLSTKWVTDKIDNIKKTEILNKMLETGRLTGAEYYSAVSGKTEIINGLEEKEPYLENLKRFGDIVGNQEKINLILNAMDESLSEIKQQYYTKRQHKLEELSKNYIEGKITPQKYYALLSKHIEKLGIDLSKYENTFTYIMLLELQKNLDYSKITNELQNLILLLRENLANSAYQMLVDNTENFSKMDKLYGYIVRISRELGLDLTVNFPNLDNYFGYIELSQKINPLELIDEEKRLTEEINTRFSETKAQREVVFLTNFRKYLGDYVTSKITSDDYNYYKENIDTYRQLWNKYVDNKVLGLLDEYILEADKFYKINTDRNIYFTRNMFHEGEKLNKIETEVEAKGDVNKIIENMKGVKEVDVVITGGFHSQTVTDILKNHGVSYIVITPNVTDGTKLAEETYYQIAKEQSKISFQALATLPFSAYPENLRIRAAVGAFGATIAKELFPDKIAVIDSVNTKPLDDDEVAIAQQMKKLQRKIEESKFLESDDKNLEDVLRKILGEDIDDTELLEYINLEDLKWVLISREIDSIRAVLRKAKKEMEIDKNGTSMQKALLGVKKVFDRAEKRITSKKTYEKKQQLIREIEDIDISSVDSKILESMKNTDKDKLNDFESRRIESLSRKELKEYLKLKKNVKKLETAQKDISVEKTEADSTQSSKADKLVSQQEIQQKSATTSEEQVVQEQSAQQTNEEQYKEQKQDLIRKINAVNLSFLDVNLLKNTRGEYQPLIDEIKERFEGRRLESLSLKDLEDYWELKKKILNIYEIKDANAVKELVGEMFADIEAFFSLIGYSDSPENYSDITLSILSPLMEKMSEKIGKGRFGILSSPTASKGSIDATSTMLAQMYDALMLYVTATGYLKYVETDKFPKANEFQKYFEKVKKEELTKNGTNLREFLTAFKFVAETGDIYSQAVANTNNTDSSNIAIIIGGRAVSIEDLINAVIAENEIFLISSKKLSEQTPVIIEKNGKFIINNSVEFVLFLIKLIEEGFITKDGTFADKNFMEKNSNKLSPEERDFYNFMQAENFKDKDTVNKLIKLFIAKKITKKDDLQEIKINVLFMEDKDADKKAIKNKGKEIADKIWSILEQKSFFKEALTYSKIKTNGKVTSIRRDVTVFDLSSKEYLDKYCDYFDDIPGERPYYKLKYKYNHGGYYSNKIYEADPNYPSDKSRTDGINIDPIFVIYGENNVGFMPRETFENVYEIDSKTRSGVFSAVKKETEVEVCFVEPRTIIQTTEGRVTVHSNEVVVRNGTSIYAMSIEQFERIYPSNKIENKIFYRNNSEEIKKLKDAQKILYDKETKTGEEKISQEQPAQQASVEQQKDQTQQKTPVIQQVQKRKKINLKSLIAAALLVVAITFFNVIPAFAAGQEYVSMQEPAVVAVQEDQNSYSVTNIKRILASDEMFSQLFNSFKTNNTWFAPESEEFLRESLNSSISEEVQIFVNGNYNGVMSFFDLEDVSDAIPEVIFMKTTSTDQYFLRSACAHTVNTSEGPMHFVVVPVNYDENGRFIINWDIFPTEIHETTHILNRKKVASNQMSRLRDEYEATRNGHLALDFGVVNLSSLENEVDENLPFKEWLEKCIFDKVSQTSERRVSFEDLHYTQWMRTYGFKQILQNEEEVTSEFRKFRADVSFDNDIYYRNVIEDYDKDIVIIELYDMKNQQKSLYAVIDGNGEIKLTENIELKRVEGNIQEETQQQEVEQQAKQQEFEVEQGTEDVSSSQQQLTEKEETSKSKLAIFAFFGAAFAFISGIIAKIISRQKEKKVEESTPLEISELGNIVKQIDKDSAIASIGLDETTEREIREKSRFVTLPEIWKTLRDKNKNKKGKFYSDPEKRFNSFNGFVLGLSSYKLNGRKYDFISAFKNSKFGLNLCGWFDGANWLLRNENLGPGYSPENYLPEVFRDCRITGRKVYFFLPPGLNIISEEKIKSENKENLEENKQLASMAAKGNGITKRELQWIMDHPEVLQYVEFVVGAYDFLNVESEAVYDKYFTGNKLPETLSTILSSTEQFMVQSQEQTTKVELQQQKTEQREKKDTNVETISFDKLNSGFLYSVFVEQKDGSIVELAFENFDITRQIFVKQQLFPDGTITEGEKKSLTLDEINKRFNIKIQIDNDNQIVSIENIAAKKISPFLSFTDIESIDTSAKKIKRQNIIDKDKHIDDIIYDINSTDKKCNDYEVLRLEEIKENPERFVNNLKKAISEHKLLVIYPYYLDGNIDDLSNEEMYELYIYIAHLLIDLEYSLSELDVNFRSNLKECLKNAFFHGNALDPKVPIYVHFDDSMQQFDVYNVIKNVDRKKIGDEEYFQNQRKKYFATRTNLISGVGLFYKSLNMQQQNGDIDFDIEDKKNINNSKDSYYKVSIKRKGTTPSKVIKTESQQKKTETKSKKGFFSRIRNQRKSQATVRFSSDEEPIIIFINKVDDQYSLTFRPRSGEIYLKSINKDSFNMNTSPYTTQESIEKLLDLKINISKHSLTVKSNDVGTGITYVKQSNIPNILSSLKGKRIETIDNQKDLDLIKKYLKLKDEDIETVFIDNKDRKNTSRAEGVIEKNKLLVVYPFSNIYDMNDLTEEQLFSLYAQLNTNLYEALDSWFPSFNGTNDVQILGFTTLFEFMKNAFIHGNLADLSKPIYIKYDENGFTVYNVHNEEQTSDEMLSISAMAGLSGAHVGLKNAQKSVDDGVVSVTPQQDRIIEIEDKSFYAISAFKNKNTERILKEQKERRNVTDEQKTQTAQEQKKSEEVQVKSVMDFATKMGMNPTELVNLTVDALIEELFSTDSRMKGKNIILEDGMINNDELAKLKESAKEHEINIITLKISNKEDKDTRGGKVIDEENKIRMFFNSVTNELIIYSKQGISLSVEAIKELIEIAYSEGRKDLNFKEEQIIAFAEKQDTTIEDIQNRIRNAAINGIQRAEVEVSLDLSYMENISSIENKCKGMSPTTIIINAEQLDKYGSEISDLRKEGFRFVLRGNIGIIDTAFKGDILLDGAILEEATEKDLENLEDLAANNTKDTLHIETQMYVNMATAKGIDANKIYDDNGIIPIVNIEQTQDMIGKYAIGYSETMTDEDINNMLSTGKLVNILCNDNEGTRLENLRERLANIFKNMFGTMNELLKPKSPEQRIAEETAAVSDYDFGEEIGKEMEKIKKELLKSLKDRDNIIKRILTTEITEEETAKTLIKNIEKNTMYQQLPKVIQMRIQTAISKDNYFEAIGTIRGAVNQIINQTILSKLEGADRKDYFGKKYKEYRQYARIRVIQLVMIGEDLDKLLELRPDTNQTVEELFETIKTELNKDVRKTITANKTAIKEIETKEEIENAKTNLKNINALLEDSLLKIGTAKQLEIPVIAVRSILAAA